MINLDPSLLDQDKIRKEKRKQLMKRYSVSLVLLLLVALFFLSTWIYNLVYLVSYSGKNYPISEGFTETRFIINILEPYIADYNQGTARLKMGKYEEAEKSFTESLKKSPAEDRLCQIYVNLSLSIEFQADKLLKSNSFNKSMELYGRAQTILLNNNCAEKGTKSSGKDSKAEIAETRLNKKLKDAADMMNHTQTADDDANTNPDEKQIDDNSLKDIQNQVVSPNGIRSDLYSQTKKYCNYNSGKCQ
jgi:tetratricopeptide (TPR) repeat protein